MLALICIILGLILSYRWNILAWHLNGSDAFYCFKMYFVETYSFLKHIVGNLINLEDHQHIHNWSKYSCKFQT